MSRISNTSAIPGFIADPASVMRDTGRQVNFDKMSGKTRSGTQIVQLNGAAAIGATSLTVDALPAEVPLDTFLDFGQFSPVTVQINGATLAGATSLTVDALTGPIPAGTRLDFTGAGEMVLTTAAAAAAATTIAIEAADAAIEDNDTALFAGGTQQARVTASADKGATTIAVDELQFGIADNAQASFFGSGSKSARAGTIMAELADGTIIPRSEVTGAETATHILLETAAENSNVASLSGFGVVAGGLIYGELLPDAANAAFATWKTELEAAGPFRWTKYEDSRAA